jgi:hypothetical protein
MKTSFDTSLPASAAKSSQLRFRSPLGAAADKMTKLVDYGICNRVVDAVAVAAAAQQAGFIKFQQVPGHIGLVAVEFRNDFTYRAGTFFEDLQNAQALRLAHGTETAGDAFDHGISKFPIAHRLL